MVKTVYSCIVAEQIEFLRLTLSSSYGQIQVIPFCLDINRYSFKLIIKLHFWDDSVRGKRPNPIL